MSERFFLEHGMWHDRETGQHMYTEDQYYEKYRDGLEVGRELVLSELHATIEKLRATGYCLTYDAELLKTLLDCITIEVTKLGRTK